MTYYNEHSKVWLSVDCIIFGFDEGKLKILIGKRKMRMEPLRRLRWRRREC